MIKQIIFFLLSFALGYQASGHYNQIITIEKTGQGAPMILIHGMACSAEVWSEVADYYKDSYELHIVSIPGFGNKDTLIASHVLKAIRDAVISYAQEQQLKKPILMGHSMGGFISLWAAAEATDLFGKIISIDGLPYFPVLAMPGITAETAVPIVEQMQQGMRNQNPETARVSQEMMIASMIGKESKREKVVEMGLNSNPDVIAQAMGEMFTTDIRKEVGAIKQPVLAMGSWYAYRDYGVTREMSTMGYKAQFEKIPNARFEMADTALHFIFYDDPDWFYALVDSFLTE